MSSDYDHEFTFTDRAQLDIAKQTNVEEFFSKHAFDIVLNCAAYTAVDHAEKDQENAFLINEKGVENLVKACEKFKIVLIHFSTDYVFDGNKNLPYLESDETNPLGIYGRSKLAGEQKILNSNCSSLIFRTSWLYAKHGKNFYTTMLRLGKEKPEINVVCDQIGTPTNTRDLAKAVMHSLENMSIWEGRQEIYHFSNEGVASWYDFAKAIMESNSLKCKVNPIPTKNYPTPAKRPVFSVLNKEKFKTHFGFKINHWRESLLS